VKGRIIKISKPSSIKKEKKLRDKQLAKEAKKPVRPSRDRDTV
jgi:hypothetical protein